MKRKLLSIFKVKGNYYAFEFDTHIQAHVENFMSWYHPGTDYWMGSTDMFKEKKLNYSISKKHPYHYMIGKKILSIRADVHVHKSGLKFTL